MGDFFGFHTSFFCPSAPTPSYRSADGTGSTYGCLWTEKEVVYYWDGKEIDRKPNTHAQRPGPVIFSTAVFPWAGPISDALHETSMDVDWVRVWRRDATPAPAR